MNNTISLKKSNHTNYLMLLLFAFFMTGATVGYVFAQLQQLSQYKERLESAKICMED